MTRERFRTIFRTGATLTLILGLKYMKDHPNPPWYVNASSNPGKPTFVSPVEEVHPTKESTSKGKIAEAFTKSVQYWRNSLERWAESAGLDPNLLATVMQIESCGDPNAISPSEAMGLFQVMPFNFPEEAQKDPQRMLNTELNAQVATGILKNLLEKTNGNVRLALAAYNGGNIVLNNPDNTEKWPKQTQRYYEWARIYEEVKQDPQQSPTLNKWLSFGGTSLCKQAEERLGINQK